MSTPPPTQTAGKVPSGTTQTINGVTIKIRDTAPLVISKTILHKMHNRDGMLSDKLDELFVKATRVQHTKYDFMSLFIDDQDKLDDTYNLEKNIERTREVMGNYDYDNVFNIVEQDKTIGSPENLVLTKTRDLFKDYAIMTPNEVAWSNKWYRTWTAEIWFEQNLKLSFDLLENHCSEELWEKTMDKYNHHSEVEKGGPLFFVIMMSKLLSNTEEASDALTKPIRDFKISNLQGENVDKATSLLGRAVKRLAQINRVPQNIVRTMLQIMQTTSVPKFNNMFELMETSRFVNDCEPTLHVGVTGQFNVNTFFSIAEQKYASMMEANQWNGVSNKGSKSTFITVGSGKEPVCWNYGGPHRLPDCTLPKNQEKISEGKKKMHDAMKKTSKTSWRSE
jgi:hypothetical protein